MTQHMKIKPAQLLVPVSAGASNGQMNYWNSTAGVWSPINANGMYWDSGNSKLVLGSGTGINEFSIDGTLSGESDDVVPTEKAIKTYVDTAIADSTGGGSVTNPGGADGNIQYNNAGAFGGEATLFWDDTNDRLGIGVTPSLDFEIAKDTQWVGNFYRSAYAGGADGGGVVRIGRSRGTIASPEALDSGDVFGSIAMRAYGASSWKNGVLIQAVATQDWTETVRGSSLIIALNAQDSNTQTTRMTIDQDGKVSLTSGTGINEFSIDGTLGDNSDDAVPTEKAVKTYVDAQSGTSPAGADTYVQYNNGGVFGGESTFYFEDGIGRVNANTVRAIRDGSTPIFQLQRDGSYTGTNNCGQINFMRGSDGVATILGSRDEADDAGALKFQTQPTGGAQTTRITIKSTGLVGIGTGDPDKELTVVGTIRAHAESNHAKLDARSYSATGTHAGKVQLYSARGTKDTPTASQSGDDLAVVSGLGYGTAFAVGSNIITRATQTWTASNHGTSMSFYTTPDDSVSNTLAMTIDQNGRVGIKESDPQRGLHVYGTNWQSAAIAVERYEANAGGSSLNFFKGRAGTIVQDNDVLGVVNFYGYDGVNQEIAAEIIGRVNGTPGSNDMPGELVFLTTPDGSTTPAERMTITADGKVTLSSGTGINEFSTDGTLGGNSNDAVPTEQAVKTYVDAQSGTSPGGADGNIQYNNSGVFGGEAALFWDDSNKRLGIGTNSPDRVLTIEDDSSQVLTSFRTMSATPTAGTHIRAGRSRGTQGSEADVADGDLLGAFACEGYGNGGWAGSSSIRFNATQAWTGANDHGAEINFYTCENSTAGHSLRMTIDHDGKVTLSSGTGINEFSIDGTLIGNSDDVVPTEKAVKTYVDANAGGSPGGADTQIQFNDSGSFGASSSLTFDGTGLALATGTSINEFSTDGTLAGDSDDAVPTEKAVKTYVDAIPRFYVDQSGATDDSYGVLAGSIDGTNTTYTVAQGVYQTGTLLVYLNGQLQMQGAAQDWEETTPASGTFDFTNPPLTDDTISVTYGYATASASSDIIKTDTTINVPSDFATLQLAMDWVESKVLLALVTIQIADGTYYPSATYSFTHPNYALVKIIGNTTTPANVTMDFQSLGVCFFVQFASLHTLSGIKMINGTYHVLADRGSNIPNLDDIISDNASNTGVWARELSHITTRRLTTTNHTNYGFYCYGSSEIRSVDATITNNGVGSRADTKGLIRLNGSPTESGNGTDRQVDNDALITTS